MKDTNITLKTASPSVLGLKQQVVVFKLGMEEYALSIDQVKEVVPTPKIVPVPQTPDCIKGIASIRGNLIAVIDLEKKFNLNPYPDHDDTYILVLENQQYNAGIVVKEIPLTLSLTGDQISPFHDTFLSSAMDQSCIRGIAHVEERLITLLDAFRIMDFSGYNELYSRRN